MIFFVYLNLCIEFRKPAHPLITNIEDSYLWRYLYLPSEFMYYPLLPAHPGEVEGGAGCIKSFC